MPYANNEGVRIYYEVEGAGPLVVLQHSLGRNLQAWRQLGYKEGLKKDYRLILIDARGHGQSDKPHEPGAYRMGLMARDVVAVLDDLGVGKAHYVGYSLGAFIGYAVAKFALSRVHSLVLGGGSPHGFRDEGVKQFLGQIRGAIQMGLEKGMEAVIAFREQMAGRPLSPEERARELANDPQAILALLDAMPEWDWAGVEDILAASTVPCLIYAGEGDPFYPSARECVKHIPSATFVSLPGLEHTVALERSDLALPHIKDFLAKVSKK